MIYLMYYSIELHTPNCNLYFHGTVQAQVQSNLFVVSGNGVTKPLESLFPGILNQLGAEGLQSLMQSMKGLGGAGPAAGVAADDDDVPDLVENFEDVSEK